MSIMLDKQGFFFKENGERVKPHQLLTVWHNAVEIAEQVIAGDLFDFVKNLRKDDPNIFQALCCLMNANISPYLNKYAGPVIDDDDLLECVQLSKVMEFGELGSTKKKNFEFYISCSGYGRISPNENKEHYPPGATHCRYAIEMTDWAKLANYPIVLLKNPDAVDWADLSNKDPAVKDRVDFFRSHEVWWSVGDLLRGIFWELTFFGGPEETEETIDTLKKAMAEIADEKNLN